MEDGIEEDNEISYNQAALIHPIGPIHFPNYYLPSGDCCSQQLPYYNEDPDKLILPSDMAAAGFYITNAYNHIFGNAASGGWAGFAFPMLDTPLKLHLGVTGVYPIRRPFKTPFRGNSAHSTGHWWFRASAIYFGGYLTQPGGKLRYTAGRVILYVDILS